MSRQIREGTSEDLDVLARMFMSAYAAEPWYETWSFETAKERVYEVMSSPKSLCLVYEEDGVMMGCILGLYMSWHTGIQLEGKEVFVDPRYQRRGIAGRLIRQAEVVASDLGVTEFFFWTLRDKNSPDPDRLFNYYRKLGFNTADERIVMTKSLGARLYRG